MRVPGPCWSRLEERSRPKLRYLGLLKWGGVQFLITFGTISYHMYSARILPYFAVFFEIRCILPYFESIDFGQI